MLEKFLFLKNLKGVLVIALLISLLGGCGGGRPTSGDSRPDTNDQRTPPVQEETAQPQPAQAKQPVVQVQGRLVRQPFQVVEGQKRQQSQAGVDQLQA